MTEVFRVCAIVDPPYGSWPVSDSRSLTINENSPWTKVFLSTYVVSYPGSYAGNQVPSINSEADLDGDGLSMANEISQVLHILKEIRMEMV